MLFDHFIKGANKSLWAYSNFAYLIKWLLVGLICVFMMINVMWFYLMTTPYERYLLFLNMQVSIRVKLQSSIHDKQQNNSTMEWMTPQGKKITVYVKDYLNSPYYIQSWLIAKNEIYKGVLISTIATLFLLASITAFFIMKGRKETDKKLLRGVKIVSARKLNKMLARKNMKSNIPIGNSFLVKGTDIEHILLLGAMRQGKSTAINWFIDNFQGKKLVWDPTGDFIKLFYRPGKDYILNSFDERSEKWNAWAECTNEIEFNAMAKSLIPSDNLVGDAFFWATTAQNIFVAVANSLMERGEKKTEILLQYLFSVDLESISSLIKGTEAEVLMAKEVAKMAISIKSVLTTHIKCFKYLKDDSENLFSIKKWMHDEKNNDSMLFISADEVQLKTLKPLISLWIDTAIQSLMTLPPDRNRRVGFYFDEIARLQYLPSLEGGMTLSPKYGGYFVLGAQSISQFEKNYGPVSTNILFDACSTKVYFRLPSVKTAKWASADIGEEELEEKRETMSISGNTRQGGSLSSNDQIRVRYPVSYTEIKNLEKLTAFLNLPGNWPIAKIKFKIFDKKEIAPAFVPAEVKPIKITPIQADEEVADTIREKISQMKIEEMAYADN